VNDIGSWFTPVLLGIGIVLAGLVVLIRASKNKRSFAKKGEDAKPASAAAPVAPVAIAAQAALDTRDRKLFDAILAAAIASYTGSANGLRIHSVTRLSAAPQPSPSARGPMVAAVSAAIATAMGTEPSGLRIHSIKQV
jgi:hypothetical protein